MTHFSRCFQFLLVFAIASTCGAAEPDVERMMWQDPGDVERLDLTHGAGGATLPQPPYRFLEENTSGTSPKMTVRDANGRTWRVKLGDEVNAQVFASRIAWACGYYSEACYFVRFGHVEGVKNPQRIAAHLKGGHFLSGCFALNDPAIRLLKNESWTWENNPFVGSRELNGLKTLMILLSNWDNKDGRDLTRGSNTVVLERDLRDRRQWVYAVTDWGASMGKWGGVATREKWDPRGFADQTPHFVVSVLPGRPIEWGFKGQHTSTFGKDIRVEDVRWLMQYLGRVSDAQIRQALDASGAAQTETESFSRAVRERIARLAEVSGAVGQNISRIPN
jgi:hypothetical protein